MTELEQLQVENEALRKAIQVFASISLKHPEMKGLAKKVEEARNILREYAARKKPIHPPDDAIERLAMSLDGNLRMADQPLFPITIRRTSLRTYEAYIEELQDAVPPYRGNSIQEALQRLHAAVKNYFLDDIRFFSHNPECRKHDETTGCPKCQMV